jgi:hypothetical protein
MERTHTIAGAPEVRLAVRVRGMSHEHRFFDELASTTRLTPEFIVIRLRDKVDPDSELHVTNMHNQVGGTFRVAWINMRAEEGLHAVGLELLDPEGEIWEQGSIPYGSESANEPPVALLECQRCHQKVSTPLPEAEVGSLGEGFTIARHCDPCRATTTWTFVIPAAPAKVEAEPEAALVSATGKRQIQKEQRLKGRAPLRMPIKTIRHRYGAMVFDVAETINVSRTGVYFATDQSYEVGGEVKIILPYHPNGMAIAVPARVVRQDEPTGVNHKRVAIHLTP